MIILSRALVLSDQAESALNPVIGWRNVVVVGGVSSTTTDVDFPASNLANPATHLKWKGGVNAGDEYLTVVTNSIEDIDYLAVARHNFGSANITVSVEGCEDLSDSPQVWTELVEEHLLADDTPILFRFEPGAYAGIRLCMQQGDDLPEAAVMYVGKLLVLERSIKINDPHVPFPMGIVSKEINGKSESGNYLGRIEINRYNQSSAEFEWFDPIWYRENFQPFVAARPSFFFAWNPTEYPTEVGYAWLTDNPLPEVDPVTRRVAIDLKMQGIV